jgi:hypothetical protein
MCQVSPLSYTLPNASYCTVLYYFTTRFYASKGDHYTTNTTNMTIKNRQNVKQKPYFSNEGNLYNYVNKMFMVENVNKSLTRAFMLII